MPGNTNHLKGFFDELQFLASGIWYTRLQVVQPVILGQSKSQEIEFAESGLISSVEKRFLAHLPWLTIHDSSLIMCAVAGPCFFW